MVQQVKFTLHEAQLDFIKSHSKHGFKDRSSMVRAALDQLKSAIDHKRLLESAELYAVEYSTDSELQELTELALLDLPDDDH